ncbi:GNAT family N-acetyltransferase [Thalassotalea sp. M1531]|uniref:GNAT family N-acetyltransferase n=1 Tax=Thalassotalea algicola TaxID=2716224 RepID=A0A7Y0LE71_9GAMM|nr:GNAT family protein [Thalassotalea algicola]NMP32893.1 GNAT family N-acetyltransferase [Thalassotalea algicola]
MAQSIDSERFILKELTPKDASLVYLSWLNNQDTAKYIEHCQQELTELADYIEINYQNPNCLFLGIFTQEQKLHIGNIKYESMNNHPTVATMGILIGDTNWHGKGVAGEVLQASFPLVRENLKANVINLGVEKSNIPAIKAYEKVGFKVKTNGYYQFDDDAIEMIITI